MDAIFILMGKVVNHLFINNLYPVFSFATKWKNVLPFFRYFNPAIMMYIRL